MRPLSGRGHPSPCQSTFHKVCYGTSPPKSAMRRVIADEHAPAVATRSVPMQITCNGFCNIRRERQLRPSSTLAAHGDSCFFPINVLEFQPDNLACPQTKPGQKQQDGVVAPTQGSSEITRT